MTTELSHLDSCSTISEGTLNSSLRASLLMNSYILDQHLDLTSLVTELAFVLHLLNKRTDHTVGHVGWHLLAANWTSLDSAPAGSADNVAGRAAGHRQVSGEAEAHWTLQGGLHNLEQLDGGSGNVGI